MSDKCRYSTSDIQDIEMVGNLGIPKSTLDEILLFKGFCSLIKMKIKGFTNIDYFRYT